MTYSINKLSEFTGFSHQAIRRRVRELKLKVPVDPRDVLQLKAIDQSRKASSLEQARTMQAEADAELKRLQCGKISGEFIKADDVRQEVGKLFEAIAATIKRSTMDEPDKKDLMESLAECVAKW